MSELHDEVVSFEADKTQGQMPREGDRRRNGAPPRPPALWNVRPTVDLDEQGEWGQYPKDFLAWATRVIGCRRSEVLHICSGSLPLGEGVRVDLRSSVRPDVVADGRRLPFADGSFAGVLIDPPYSLEYARDLYETEYPRPSHLLAEALRVVQPCGRFGILHFLVPMSLKGSSLVGVYGLTTGAGYRIRAFTVFARDQEELPFS